MTKSNPGHYFEDFKPGMELVHATPLTVSTGDISLYRALTGSRHALFSAETFATANGFEALPVDPLLAFHVVLQRDHTAMMAGSGAHIYICHSGVW